eukprot:TRINITY_DN6095_c0_g1_i2.p1 TRINITY_DN6095_c0_g1~~TRINITY_DN6095_c0_g1_i2.p1  ORF type:complete len:216 (-),score=23.54 TRINITY_DN6095_c0_g1_i2:18-665(-)
MIMYMLYTEGGIPHREMKLNRTERGKPYHENLVNKFTNFNFNVSHSDGWVVGGSEPYHLIGVDVMGLNYVKARNQNIDEFLTSFVDCFTQYEWKYITSGINEDQRNFRFFLYWTLKESYIKAVGIGLGFTLKRSEFRVNESQQSAVMYLDGELLTLWAFYYKVIDDVIVSVAYGPPEEALHCFKCTATPKEHELKQEKLSFKIVTIKELINHFIK